MISRRQLLHRTAAWGFVSTLAAATHAARAAAAPVLTPPSPTAPPPTTPSSTTPSPAAPFLTAPWTGPLQLPPFDKARSADFAPAFDAAFKAHMAEIDAIADQSAPANFENTFAAMERSGRPLTRVSSIFNLLTGAMSDAALQAVEQEVNPRIAAHNDAVSLRPGLYRRVARARARHGDLTPEQTRVAERYDTLFVRSGARLGRRAKARLTAINQRLAGLFTTFAHNELADEENYSLTLEREADLEGLPETLRANAAAAAKAKKLDGKWVIANTRSAMEPFLTYSSRRDLRERGWRMWIMRGDNGDAHDNKAAITEILALRAERARLLGYPTHAHYQLADAMAATPEATLALMHAVWTPAVKAALADRDRFQAMIDTEKGGFKLQPWDWRYYAERVRKAEYDVDEAEVKPYLQLWKFREATFWCANRLYGLTFEPRDDAPVYHPDVKVWTVRTADGATLGLYYFDPFARPGKNSGAWMNEIRSEEQFDGKVMPLVSNVCNFAKPAPGEPPLLSLDDAVTTFHEFGHALHGLLSATSYPLVAGTNVPRDFVEFPSQFNEHWGKHPEILERFAVHYKTGAPMPKALIDRLSKAANFNQGFAMVELIASAYVDMDMHLAGARTIDPAQFEKDFLARLGMPAEIVLRHRPTQFGHIFSSDNYSAGYYSYLWSQVLDNDAFAAFEEAGDIFDPATAKRMKDEVLTRGNSRDPAASYRAFRGRDPRIDALLRNRGFV